MVGSKVTLKVSIADLNLTVNGRHALGAAIRLNGCNEAITKPAVGKVANIDNQRVQRGFDGAEKRGWLAPTDDKVGKATIWKLTDKARKAIGA